jgi:hypothetical protein
MEAGLSGQEKRRKQKEKLDRERGKAEGKENER